jgi:ubiquitin-like 1-activating enzyme E1 A
VYFAIMAYHLYTHLDRFRADLGSHLASHATHFFPPTVAIMGGLLAQDVLRALSRKDTPIVNLLVVDSMGGNGVTGRWAMAEGKDVEA